MIQGLKTPNMHLNKNALPDFHSALQEKYIGFRIVPTFIHWWNIVYNEISNFKDLFISFLFSADLYFPMYDWEHLLKRSEINLNILYLSRLNPSM